MTRDDPRLSPESAGETRSEELEEGRRGESAAPQEGSRSRPEPENSGDEESEDNDGGPPARQRPGGPF